MVAFTVMFWGSAVLDGVMLNDGSVVSIPVMLTPLMVGWMSCRVSVSGCGKSSWFCMASRSNSMCDSVVLFSVAFSCIGSVGIVGCPGLNSL